jgi:hypothetical protein
LEWSELEKLTTPLAEVWDQVKDELELFLDTLAPDEPKA